jgi:hypothetical protein
MTHNADPNS